MQQQLVVTHVDVQSRVQLVCKLKTARQRSFSELGDERRLYSGSDGNAHTLAFDRPLQHRFGSMQRTRS